MYTITNRQILYDLIIEINWVSHTHMTVTILNCSWIQDFYTCYIYNFNPLVYWFYKILFCIVIWLELSELLCRKPQILSNSCKYNIYMYVCISTSNDSSRFCIIVLEINNFILFLLCLKSYKKGDQLLDCLYKCDCI